MKSKIKQNILIIVTLLIGQYSLAAPQYLQRCRAATTGTGANYTMSAAETKAVRKWIIRCEPRMRGALTENVFIFKMVEGKEVQIPVYPVLGKQKLVEDASFDTGYRVEYSNPLNYQIDVQGITANPDAAPCDVPSDYRIIGYCGAGCFTPDQKIWFPQGDLAIGHAETLQLNSVFSVAPDSTFENIDYQVSELSPSMYIQNAQPQKEEILTLKTRSKTLSVTPNHPVVVSGGEVRSAEDIAIGDSLVNVDGELEEVVAIKKSEFFGKVLNLDTDEESLQSHIIVAQGLLTGDFVIQNMNLNNANRFLMRSSLFPVELIK